MRLLSIHLVNIKSHRDTELLFSPGINVLSGANGAGKSTVFEAIGYALFGVDASDFVSNVKRFLSIGAKSGKISVTFQSDRGEIWQVSRTVGSSSKWLLAKKSGESFEVEEHARIEETATRIAGLLGLANGRPLPDQFKLVIGPFQNEFLGPFIIRQSTKRQEAFDEILGIDTWRKSYKGSLAMISVLNEKIRILRAEVEILQNQVAALPQKEVEYRSVAGAMEEKERELQAGELALAQLERQLMALESLEKVLNVLVTEVQVLQGRISEGGRRIAAQREMVGEAATALALVEKSRKGKEAYEVVEIRLAELRSRELQRRTLEREITLLEGNAQRLGVSVAHEKADIMKVDKELTDEERELGEARLLLQAKDKKASTQDLLQQLRHASDAIKAERSTLEGRRAALLEGKDTLADGICPFFQEPCRNVADQPAQDHFTEKINALDLAMAGLDTRISGVAQRIVLAEQQQREFEADRVRLQELEKRFVALEERRKKNRTRAEALEGVVKQHLDAVALAAAKTAGMQLHATLDEDISRAEGERKRFQPDRDLFAANLQSANDLENRQNTLVTWERALQDLEKQVIEREGEILRCRAEYQPERHEALRTEKGEKLSLVATFRQQMVEMKNTRGRLEKEILELRKLELQSIARQAEISSLERKARIVELLRNQVFKHVSAQLSERFRQEISLQADRIYRAIAESDEELLWGENYQIILRDMVDGVIRERSDDQLSGGQTMSAVVALRLALLQTIGARIAFFDEPTSNLDASRRENLAHAFRAIDAGRQDVTEHWYDQLFLVSHDVAFTEITDQMIQIGGESQG